MNDFWVLGRPYTADADRRLADRPEDEPLEFEKVFAPLTQMGTAARATALQRLCAPFYLTVNLWILFGRISGRFPLKGWRAYNLAKMKESFDVAVPGHTPPAQF